MAWQHRNVQGPSKKDTIELGRTAGSSSSGIRDVHRGCLFGWEKKQKQVWRLKEAFPE